MPPKFITRLIASAIVFLAAGLLGLSSIDSQAIAQGFSAPILNISPTSSPIDLSKNSVFIQNRPILKIATAPDATGKVLLLEANSTTGNSQNWLLIALSNKTDQSVQRVISAKHYSLVGSKLIMPELPRAQINQVIASPSPQPERTASEDSDRFVISVPAGETVTYAIELAGDRPTSLELIDFPRLAAQQKQFTLTSGIFIGITLLIALASSMAMLVRHTYIFLTTSLLLWTIFGVLLVEFGYIGQLLTISPVDHGFLLVFAKGLLSFIIVMFIISQFRLSRRTTTWLQLGFFVLSGLLMVFYRQTPELAETIVRIVMLVAIVGELVMLVIRTTKGDNKSIAILPSWVLLCAWAVSYLLAIEGMFESEQTEIFLAGGLSLAALSIGSSVLQHSLASGYAGLGYVSDVEKRAIALITSGEAFWDWDVTRQKVTIGNEAIKNFGLAIENLRLSYSDWLSKIHPHDRDNLDSALQSISNNSTSLLRENFRFRDIDQEYRLIRLAARPIIDSDGSVLRCTGTIVDISKESEAQKKLTAHVLRDYYTRFAREDLFNELLQQQMQLAANTGTDTSVVIFSLVARHHEILTEGSLGMSDQIARHIAIKLNTAFSKPNILGRLGTYKYGVILAPNSVDGRQQRAKAVAKVYGTLQNAIIIEGNRIYPEPEVGAAGSRLPYHSASELIGLASANITDQNGKVKSTTPSTANDNVARTSTDQSSSISPTEELLAEITSRLKDHLIEHEYQPFYSVLGQKLAGYSVKLGFNSANYGHITMTELVDICEAAGIIDLLNISSLHHATNLVWQLSNASTKHLHVHTPIYGYGLDTSAITRFLSARTSGQPIDRKRLNVTIQEDFLARNPEHTKNVISTINRLDIRPIISDFGACGAPIGYLQKLDIEAVKIEPKAILQLNKPGAKNEIKNLVQVASTLGYKVILDNIYSPDLLSMASGLDVTFVAGKQFGPAMTLEEIISAGQVDFIQSQIR